MAKKILIIFFISVVTQNIFAQTVEEAKKLVPVISKKGNTEFSPTISADGRTLIYETQNDDKWELYESNLSDAGQWSEPVPLKAINDKCNFIAGPSLSYDGNTLFYTAFIEGTTKSEDIFYSERQGDGKWSEPKSIGAPINQDEEYEGFPSISSDGNALYFIRINAENDYDKKSKETCFRIYVSHKEENGSWREPVPLPQEVNSGCERDPRIMADNHTLIFSSIREGGLGKYDLYQTRKKTDGSWEIAVPLNFVNSPENDQSPCISASGTTMYYYTNNDIYQTPIPGEYRQLINVTIKGSVNALADHKPIDARLVVKNLKTGEDFVANSNSDGKFSIVLAAGESYEVSVSHPDYIATKMVMDYTEQKTYLEERKEIKLGNEWNLAYTVKDKDVPVNVTAFVKISDKGTVVFQDSIRNADYPKSIKLKAGKTYDVAVYAPGYEPLTSQLTRDKDTATVVPMTALIEHEKVQVVADVTDISSGNKKRTKVTYKNETTDEVIIAEAGEVVNLRKGDRYQIITNSEKGYAYSMKTVVAGEGVVAGKAQSVDVPVTTITEGAKLSLNHIYFKSGSYELDKASELELSNIISLLQLNPNVSIEIAAHTDDVGEDEFNQQLSEKRASSVTSYLTKHGVPIKQLLAKGYGKTKPLVENVDDESRAQNRRVELLILKVD